MNPRHLRILGLGISIGAMLVLAALESSSGKEPASTFPRAGVAELPTVNQLRQAARTNSTSAAQSETTYFGGTVWAPDSARWEAVEGGTWTFDSGVGSHFDHEAPFVQPKDSTLHALMEGWIGFDAYVISPGPSEFRRLHESDFSGSDVCVGDSAGLGGNFSFWAGFLYSEAIAAGYTGGQGYGDNWLIGIEQTFNYSGAGTVTLEFDYVVDTEPNYDFVYVLSDTTGSGEEFQLQVYDGVLSGNESLILAPGAGLPTTGAGPITIRFLFSSDYAWSDEDGSHDTVCGAFAVDNIQLSGAIVAGPMTFEDSEDGWVTYEPEFLPNGALDWSNIRHLGTFPALNDSGPCALQDSVLAFEDITRNGHANGTDVVAISPWIDLRRANLVGTERKFIEFDLYGEPILGRGGFIAANSGPAYCGPQNSIFVSVSIQCVPCWTSFPASGPSAFVTVVNFGFSEPFCTSPDQPLRFDVTTLLYMGAEQVRLSVGIYRNCFPNLSSCESCQHPSPYFDNIRFGVVGASTPTPATETPPQFDFLWGTTGEGEGQFDLPLGIAVDQTGLVYVGDRTRIQKFTADGQFLAQFGDSGTGPGQFVSARGLDFSPDGNLFITDEKLNRVQKLDNMGNYILEWGTTGTAEGQFDAPLDIAVDDSGFVYVADYRNHRIQKFTDTGVFVAAWGNGQSSAPGEFNRPGGIAVGPDGRLYVTDKGKGGRIQVFTSDGDLVRYWGSALHCNAFPGTQSFQPRPPAVDNSGNVYLGDFSLQQIQKFIPTGMFLSTWGGKGVNPGEFGQLGAIAIDRTGNLIYVVDGQEDRVTRFSYSTTGGPFPEPPTPARVFPPYPNPSSGEIRVPIQLPTGATPVHIRMDVFDLSGRLVRSLKPLLVDQGTAELRWDGLTTKGAQAAPGVYFIRIRTKDQLLGTAKIVRLR